MRRALAVLALLLSACRSQPPAVLEGPAGFTPAAALTDEPFEYRVGPLDVLRVNVFGHPELSSPLLDSGVRGSPVDGRGEVQLPLLGALEVGGLSLAEISARVTHALERYLRAPRVDTAVVRFGAHRFLVLGSVKRPGAYAMEHPVTLYEAIAVAGGFDSFANRVQIAWVRGALAAENLVLFDAGAIDPMGSTRLAPGDLVFVSQRAWADVSEAARDLIPILQAALLPLSIALQAATLERLL